MLRRLAFSAAVVLGLASAASASYRPFAFSYDTYPMGKGEVEFEQWVTYKGHKESEKGFTRLDFREEIEIGLADNFTLGIYLPNWRYEDSNSKDDVEFKSVSAEGILYLTNPVTDFIGIGLYTEVSVGEEELEFEHKLLLHKDIGNWTFAYNLIFETELEHVFGGEETEVEGVIGHTFGASYALSPAWRLGGEMIIESAYEDWSEYQGTTVYAGPVFSYQGKNVPGTDWSWWVTVTPTVQLTDKDDEPDYMVRMLMGIEF